MLTGYWRQGGRDYGWPEAPGIVGAELWAPVGQEVPWAEKVFDDYVAGLGSTVCPWGTDLPEPPGED